MVSVDGCFGGDSSAHTLPHRQAHDWLRDVRGTSNLVGGYGRSRSGRHRIYRESPLDPGVAWGGFLERTDVRSNAPLSTAGILFGWSDRVACDLKVAPTGGA